MKAKRIYLQLLPATKEGFPDSLDYKKVLAMQLSEAPTGGYTVGQMKARFDLIDSLEAATEYWDVDHRSWEALIKELEAKKWGLVSKNLVKFLDNIRDAQDVVAPEKVVEFPVEKLD